MSAFVVNKTHIDAIVTAWIHLGGEFENPSRREERANQIGTMLWRENVLSVNYRYGDHLDGDLPGPMPTPDPGNYEYEPVKWVGWPAVPTQAVAILGDLLACYEYQSCEHPGWQASEAKALVDRMRCEALARIPIKRDVWEARDKNVFTP